MKNASYLIHTSIITTFLIAVLSGCGDSPTSDDLEELPESDLSFSKHILPVFNNHCAPCHINQNQNGVNLASYGNVMESLGNQYNMEIVKPGEPDESPLIDKLEPNPEFGDRMPQGGSLNNDQILAIRTWIEEGAENN